MVTDGIRVGGTIFIGDEHLTINWTTSDKREIWVDCEEQEAWEVVGGEDVSINAWIDGAEYLTIQPGRNDVSFTNSFELVQIYTRAYTL